ncbi:hypothetical protein NX059_004435 [Plenodomus lindquistii]|nr:hypothetical protein NX059_004435 [Plenodomus lindquistii]
MHPMAIPQENLTIKACLTRMATDSHIWRAERTLVAFASSRNLQWFHSFRALCMKSPSRGLRIARGGQLVSTLQERSEDIGAEFEDGPRKDALPYVLVNDQPHAIDDASDPRLANMIIPTGFGERY